MSLAFATVVAISMLGQHGPNCRCYPQEGGRIMPPGPGYGWGFVNGNPDGYGWVDYGTFLPLGGDRTADYFFRRHYTVPVQQMFMPTYYNSYVMRGQRYVPYVGGGGWHPAGGAPTGSAITPMHPNQEASEMSRAREAQIAPPRFTGREEPGPEESGGR